MSQFAPVGLRVPSGFEQLLESLAKEILRAQPTDIITFAAEYFKRKVAQREERYNQFMENDVTSNFGGTGATVFTSAVNENSTEDTNRQQDDREDALSSEDKPVSRAPEHSDATSRLQLEDSAGSRGSESPPPCSDDNSDPNSEASAPELDADQEADNTHSDINIDAEPDLNPTGDDTGSHPDAEMDRESHPPDSDPNPDTILSQSDPNDVEPSQSAHVDELPLQIPDADLAEELPQTSGADLDQELPPADPDPDEDLDRGSPQPEPDDDGDEHQLEETEQDTTGPPEEGEDQ